MLRECLTAAALVALLSGTTLANGNKTGHETTETTTQGESGKTNENANPDNQGTKTETTTGPKGQLDQGKADCNNCDTSVTDEPGASK